MVTLSYPSRPSIPILSNVTSDFPRGRMTAIAGGTGSGKSSVIRLLLRELVPQPACKAANNTVGGLSRDNLSSAAGTRIHTQRGMENGVGEDRALISISDHGRVCFNGRDVREYNIRWLRSQISIVLQDSQLFRGTILDNVAAGLRLANMNNQSQSDKEGAAIPSREFCIEALQRAEAWEFVCRLPQRINTMIGGGRNDALSRGQSRRNSLCASLLALCLRALKWFVGWQYIPAMCLDGRNSHQVLDR